MRWIPRHWRGIVRAVAALLLLGSAYVAHFWFYTIAPLRRTIDPSWRRRHSAEAYWAEVRTGIQRCRWGHDDSAGLYADAEFMGWAMAHTRMDEDISSCAAGHRDSAFRKITNQDVGESAADWLAWWKDNGAKSQEEWIRDGFAAYGVNVTIPPSDADVVPLLTLLGKVGTTEDDPGPIPGYVKYNAFRWLRDSEFNPVAFAVSHSTASTQAQIKRGLLEYLHRERVYPKQDHVGELAFGNDRRPDADDSLPVMLEPRFKAGVYGLVFGLPWMAAGLVGWTMRKPRQKGADR